MSWLRRGAIIFCFSLFFVTLPLVFAWSNSADVPADEVSAGEVSVDEVSVDEVSAELPVGETCFVQFHEGFLNVKAKDSSLRETLERVAQKSGVNILFFGSGDRKINIELVNTLLDQGLRRLLAQEDTIFFYSRVKSTDGKSYVTKLTEVRISNGQAAIGAIAAQERISQTTEFDDINQSELMNPLMNTDEDIRESVVVALGNTRDEKMIEPLTRILTDDEDEDVRESVVDALSKIGGEKAVQPLIQALDDEDEWVRESAVEALGKIGDIRALKAIERLLQREDEDEDVLEAVEDALARFGLDH